MLNEKTYRPEHQIKLFYGYQDCMGSGIFHSFEAMDPDGDTDEEEMEKHLAELLDTTPDDEDFDHGSMYIQLPETLVDRIKAEGVQEYLDTLKNK